MRTRSPRTSRTYLVASVVLAVTALAATGCGDDDGNGDGLTLGDGAEITYDYADSSVPPELHRSYTLTIDATSVHAVIDS